MMQILTLAILACAGFAHSTPDHSKLDLSLQQRIVNGTSGSAPYMVSLKHILPTNHVCGGAILSENWVLTAASCIMSPEVHSPRVSVIKEKLPQQIFIKTGSNILDAQKDVYAVEKITLHEKFNPLTMENDIALLKIRSPIKINNKNIKSISLGSGVVKVGKTAESCGWGSTGNCPREPKDLQCLKQTIISNEQCKEAFKEVFPYTRRRIHESNVCTSTPKESAVCTGDAGGPLVLDGKIIGIVSWGKNCALGDTEVYTRASSFTSWVKSKMSQN